MLYKSILCVFVALLSFNLCSAEGLVDVDWENHNYDKSIGDEINQVCAGCHGESAMGGSKGKYPRLAGMPVKYIFQEVVRFRDRVRPNISMIEHVEERQLPNEEIMDIAIYMNKIKLATKLPKLKKENEGFDAYARLKEAESVIQIGLVKGNVKKGKKIYKSECRSCHGKKGQADEEDAIPMLAGQYIEYLKRQVKLYIDLKRNHDADDPEETFFKSFSAEEIEDVFAYISTLDD